MRLSLGVRCFLATVALAGCGRADRKVTDSDSLWSAGKARYDAGAYDSATRIWSTALEHARSASDTTSQARVLTWLGLASKHRGNLADARSREREALALESRSGDRRADWRTLNALGLISLDQDENTDASARFAEALASARAAGDMDGVARVAGNVALAAGNLGDMTGARAGHRAQRAAARDLGDTTVEANGLANEAMLDIWEGDPMRAIARLDTARAMYARVGYAAGALNVWHQLATAFELTGEYDRAFAALDSALALARRNGERGDEAETLRLLAGLHSTVGDHRRAARFYAQAAAVARGLGNGASSLGSILRGSATTALSLSETERARSLGREALRLHRASGEPLEQLDDLLLLADADRAGGDRAVAETDLEAGRALAAHIGTRQAAVVIALASARAADAARDARGTLAPLRRIDETTLTLDAESAWQVHALRARAWARVGRLDSAIAAGQRAIVALQRTRVRLPSEVLRSALVADRADVYGDQVLALLRQGRTDDALAVADAARGQALLGRLGVLREEAAVGAIPTELRRREDLLGRIDALVDRLRRSGVSRQPERGSPSSATTTTDANLIAELASARDEYEAVLSRAPARSRALAVLGAEPLSVVRMRRALAPGELLVEYLLTRDTLLAFVVGQQQTSVVSTATSTESFLQRVRLLRDLWGAPGSRWTAGLDASRALDRVLLAPLRQRGLLENPSRLIIVPHGVLGQVPFAALQDSVSGRFLVEDVALTLLPSAASLAALRERPPPTQRVSRGTGLAPFPIELAASAREIESLQRFESSADLHVGAAATERALRAALTHSGIVHVATHGVLNARNPMFSRLELAASPGGGPDDDGRLETHELLSLEIRSPLVFISGCETAAGWEWSGDAVRGTGDPTLAQAFLAAGASNVIATLWRIDDAGASALVERFYTHLATMAAPEALAAAQRGLAHDARFGSPYYWAGFVLSGDARIGGTRK